MNNEFFKKKGKQVKIEEENGSKTRKIRKDRKEML